MLPNIKRQPRSSLIPVDGPNATPTILPSMMPKAVHICHSTFTHINDCASVGKREKKIRTHNQSTPDRGRSTLRGIDRHSRRLWTNSESKDKSSNEQVDPGIRHALPHGCYRGDHARHEDGSAASDDFVDGLGHPTPDERTAQIRRADNETCDVVGLTSREPGGCVGVIWVRCDVEVSQI